MIHGREEERIGVNNGKSPLQMIVSNRQRIIDSQPFKAGFVKHQNWLIVTDQRLDDHSTTRLFRL